MRVNFVLTILLLFGLVTSRGASLPQGQFRSTSVKVGEPVDFVLTNYAHRDSLILFPDTLFDYSPFELIKKTISTTQIHDSLRFDSVTYTLRTFEVKPWQHFQLPVYIVTASDSIRLYSRSDSLGIELIVPEVTRPLPLKSDTRYQQIPLLTDYLMVGIISIISIILVAVLIFTFRKPIMRKVMLMRLTKQHEQYLHRIDNLVKNNPSTTEIESFLGLWKSYLGKIDKRPIASMTSKELLALYPNDEHLKGELNLLDRSLYGGAVEKDLENALRSLRDFSIHRYHSKKNDLDHG